MSEEEREAEREAAARLAHDVGKYMARMARNVRGSAPLPSALLPLIIKDLYLSPFGGRPAERFEALAPPLERVETPRELRHARAALRGVEGLEQRVRAGEEEAVREACALALQVDGALRALSARLAEESGE